MGILTLRRRANAVDEPSVIVYTASAKLPETTSSTSEGIHVNSFNRIIKSHTFVNGVGTIVFNGSVKKIDSNAFYFCTRMSSITIPSSVTSIGNSAFQKCSGLTDIICNRMTAPSIQSSSFRDVKTGGTLTVPSGSTGYDVWMKTSNYYLGKYNWTKVEV